MRVAALIVLSALSDFECRNELKKPPGLCVLEAAVEIGPGDGNAWVVVAGECEGISSLVRAGEGEGGDDTRVVVSAPEVTTDGDEGSMEIGTAGEGGPACALSLICSCMGIDARGSGRRPRASRLRSVA